MKRNQFQVHTNYVELNFLTIVVVILSNTVFVIPVIVQKPIPTLSAIFVITLRSTKMSAPSKYEREGFLVEITAIRNRHVFVFDLALG